MADDIWQDMSSEEEKILPRYDPMKEIPMSEIEEMKSETFQGRSFKILGFSSNERLPIKNIIADNGGKISNGISYICRKEGRA